MLFQVVLKKGDKVFAHKIKSHQLFLYFNQIYAVAIFFFSSKLSSSFLHEICSDSELFLVMALFESAKLVQIHKPDPRCTKIFCNG